MSVVAEGEHPSPRFQGFAQLAFRGSVSHLLSLSLFTRAVPMDHDRLELSPEKMRTLGYRVVDLLVDHFADGGAESLGVTPARDGREAHLRDELPER